MQKYPEIFMNTITSPTQPTLSQNVTFADTLLSMTLPTLELPLVVLSGSLQFLHHTSNTAKQFGRFH